MEESGLIWALGRSQVERERESTWDFRRSLINGEKSLLGIRVNKRIFQSSSEIWKNKSYIIGMMA